MLLAENFLSIMILNVNPPQTLPDVLLICTHLYLDGVAWAAKKIWRQIRLSPGLTVLPKITIMFAGEVSFDENILGKLRF